MLKRRWEARRPLCFEVGQTKGASFHDHLLSMIYTHRSHNTSFHSKSFWNANSKRLKVFHKGPNPTPQLSPLHFFRLKSVVAVVVVVAGLDMAGLKPTFGCFCWHWCWSWCQYGCCCCNNIVVVGGDCVGPYSYVVLFCGGRVGCCCWCVECKSGWEMDMSQNIQEEGECPQLPLASPGSARPESGTQINFQRISIPENCFSIILGPDIFAKNLRPRYLPTWRHGIVKLRGPYHIALAHCH